MDGGKPLKAATDDFESLQNLTGPAKVQEIASLYPASLNTLDAIYIHLVAFETGNFMSTGHEVHAQDNFRLIESSLFARIAFDRSTFTEVQCVAASIRAARTPTWNLKSKDCSCPQQTSEQFMLIMRPGIEVPNPPHHCQNVG